MKPVDAEMNSTDSVSGALIAEIISAKIQELTIKHYDNNWK